MHIGTTGTSVTPTNIPYGFYYVSLFESLEALFNRPSIRQQVKLFSVMSILLIYYSHSLQILSGSHNSPGELLYDMCDGAIFEENYILHTSEHALQIIAYYDEFSVTNPLGTRKHKIGI